MSLFSYLACMMGMLISTACFAGEILYQDYLAESELLSSQERDEGALVDSSLDWNYHFESNSLAVALKMYYGMDNGTSVMFRPIVARYDFNGARESVHKSIRRADTCYPGAAPYGFCMVGLDTFAFSYGQEQSPKSVLMRISDFAQTDVDISRELGGSRLYGALSSSERAAFGDGGGFAFQCLGNTNGWDLLLWDKGASSLWPVPSGLRGYVCLSGGRVLFDFATASTNEVTRHGKVIAQCHQVLPRSCEDARSDAYADWTAALTNSVVALAKGDGGSSCLWSIEMHGMKASASDNELGHEFAEGEGVLYDFSGWNIFRIRREDAGWSVFDLKEFFREDIDKADESVEIPILHRGKDAWYYALLFKLKNPNAAVDRRYAIKIIEIPRRGEGALLWSFPEFNASKKLTTWSQRSPGAVYKLPDDSWVFLSNTVTFTNDAIFVQRMTGSRNPMRTDFR